MNALYEFPSLYIEQCGPSSVVGIVTAYGWMVRGSNPGGPETHQPPVQGVQGRSRG